LNPSANRREQENILHQVEAGTDGGSAWTRARKGVRDRFNTFRTLKRFLTPFPFSGSQSRSSSPASTQKPRRGDTSKGEGRLTQDKGKVRNVAERQGDGVI